MTLKDKMSYFTIVFLSSAGQKKRRCFYKHLLLFEFTSINTPDSELNSDSMKSHCQVLVTSYLFPGYTHLEI